MRYRQDSRPNWVAVTDINNDSQPDMIVANTGLKNIGVFLGYGNGSFQEQITSSSGNYPSPWFTAVGDFNNDGRLDLATANYGTRNIGVLFGYGDGTFGNLQTYSTGTSSNPTSVNIADFNNDKQLDIVVTDETSKNVGVFFGYGDGTFASISIVFIGENSLSYSIGVGHFNNDNQLDIAIANYGTNNMGIFLGYGNRLFSNITTYSTGDDSHPLSLAIGDFNNDSINDIVVANSESDNIVVFIGYGNGSFFTLTTYSMGVNSRPVSIAIGHFNRDYQLGIVVANFGLNNVCVLFGSGNATFINQKLYPMEYDSQPNWVIFKDINNDGWEDTAVVTSGTDNIKILLNLC